MPSNLSGRKLLVVSDTPVYKDAGGYLAFEPVVRELEVLMPLFDEIVWLGCKVDEKRYAMRRPGENFQIRIVAMPGVLTRFNFFRMLVLYPVFTYYLLRFSNAATHIHTRGPSHPAFLGILLSFVRRRAYWHKYAGNWTGRNLSMSYKVQRQLLKFNRNRRVRVTMNGVWPGTPPHILPFENPCFSETELKCAGESVFQKNFTGSLNVLFAGNLSSAKGILELIDAILDVSMPRRFENFFIAGDGELREVIAKKVSAYNGFIKIQLLGSQTREEMNKLYRNCHMVVLPSASEGFPKVIAEGAAHGCIPIVTDISSISQYVRDGYSGYLLKNNSPEEILKALDRVSKNEELKSMSTNAQKIAGAFTYERFIGRIQTEVFNIAASSQS